MSDEDRGCGTRDRYHIMMFSIPDAVVTEALCGLGCADAILKALRDISALDDAG